MRNIDMLEINRTKETERVIKIPEKTRKKVKEFLNEKSIFGVDTGFVADLKD